MRPGLSPGGTVALRVAREADLPEILDIYNRAVMESTATFDIEPRTLEAQQAWFREHVPPHPAIVWEEEGRVLGWASLNQFHPRRAYRFACDASVYVTADARRTGVGEALLLEIIRLGAENGLRTVVGFVTAENLASQALAEKVGFRKVGVLEEFGYKFDRWLDVAVYQYRYGS